MKVTPPSKRVILSASCVMTSLKISTLDLPPPQGFDSAVAAVPSLPATAGSEGWPVLFSLSNTHVPAKLVVCAHAPEETTNMAPANAAERTHLIFSLITDVHL